MQPLTLTPDEERMIIDEADHIVAETFAAHELFVANDRQLSRDEWKYVKSRENVSVYRSTGSDSDSDSHHGMETAGMAPSTQQASIEISKPANLPLVITTGTLLGTVEEAVFGVLGYTESLSRRRDAIIKHEFDAVKILATIHAPTPEQPYRSLVVKWMTKRLSALAQTRDDVCFEATGLATDSNGDQVGYYVYHSIDNIPRINAMKPLDVVRINLSTCLLLRRYDETSVEQFSQGFADTRGMFADGWGINTVFANFLLSSIHVVESAYVKKLIWLMNSKRRIGGDVNVALASRSSASSSSSSSHSSAPSSANSNSTSTNRGSKTCGNCDAKLSSLGSLIRSRLICMACQEAICHKCSVEKKIPMEVSRNSDMKIKQLMFCLRCVLEAKQALTCEVALAEMPAP